MKVSENLSIVFILEKNQMSRDGRVPIYARITLNGLRSEISLGYRVLPQQWDKINGRMKGSSSDDLLLYKFKKADVPLEQVKSNFAEDMLHYLIVEQELHQNTAMKYIRNTKQVLTTATGRWIGNNLIKEFRCTYRQPERDILTIHEI